MGKEINLENLKQILIDILDYNDDVHDQYDFFHKKKHDYEGIEKDVAHLYELGGIDAIDMMRLASDYRYLLKDRRRVLDHTKYVCRLNALFDKHEQFFKDLEYLLGEFSKMKRIDNKRTYHAKSKVGQELIDKYSKNKDDLITTEGELNKLKKVIEMKNCS